MNTFKKAFDSLNKFQKEAVINIEGPVMVIAGPGTGKTQMLACRIAYMLQSDSTISPNMILALTFTDAGAVAMRKRLLEFIGTEAYKVNIHTFHSFCNDIVQWNLDYFGVSELEPASEIEKLNILYEIIDGLPETHSLTRLKGDAYYEALRLKNLFSLMKNEGWFPGHIEKECKRYIDSLPERKEFIYQRGNASKGIKVGDFKKDAIDKEKEKISKLIEASKLITQYNNLLKSSGRYDFEDMIEWVTTAFKSNKYFLLSQQERYQYILVDEMQDTSGSQMILLKQLISYWDKPNIFVVGDDDQALYEFNGARIQNMINFMKEYKPDLIVPEINYRSVQPILDASAKVIPNNSNRLINFIPNLQKNLYVDRDLKTEPVVREFNSTEQENIFIIEEIEKNKNNLSDIAVIYRKHKQADHLITIFNKKGIPVNVKKNYNILQDNFINKILTILKFIDLKSKDLQADELFYHIIFYNFINIPLNDIEYTINRRYKKMIKNEDIPENDRVKTFKASINELIIFSKNNSLLLTFFKLLDDFKIINWIIKESLNESEKIQKLTLLYSLYFFIESETLKNYNCSIEYFIETIERMKKRNIPINTIDIGYETNGVNFMTAHGAKGLEFKKVYIIGCQREEWEKSRGNVNRFSLPDTLTQSISEDKLESNRRLFYVAMTRAKDELNISYASHDNNGKEIERSQFIDESGIFVSRGESRKGINYISDLLSSSTMPLSHSISQRIIDERLEQYRISVSHLNLYLRCPLSFFHEVILRLPIFPTEDIIFGNAVHRALKMLYDERKKSNVFQCANWFFDQFYYDMVKKKGYLSDNAFKRKSALGKTILESYYKNVVPQSNTFTLNEYSVSNIVLEDDIRVKYIFDKLEFNGNDVDIVDYKTGNPDAAKKKLKQGGEYWRQLVMGKLVLDNIFYKPWKYKSARLEILDPIEFQTLFCEITEEDEKIFLNDLKEVYFKIKEKDFYVGCGEKDCYWCSFKS